MNHGILTVLALALLPAAGNFAGGVVSEFIRPSKTLLNRTLHLAAGIIIAVVAVEVMPEAIGAAAAWILAVAFVAGGSLYILVEALVNRWQRGKEDSAGAGAWMVYVAVATDLVADGLLIGAGSAVSGQLGLLLALGQVLADIPEGFAVITNFRDKGVGKRRRLLLSASFAIPVVGAAALAFLVLRGQGEAVQMTVLVFVAGLYILAAVEDMLEEAHESEEDSRWSAFSFLGGFALFLLVSAGLG
jgi:ZIP family zinc transporter